MIPTRFVRSSSRWKKALAFTLGAGSLITALIWFSLKAVGMMPLAAAKEAVMLDDAFNAMLGLTVPLYGFLLSAFLAAVFFFRRNRENEEGEPVHGSRGHWVESLWIGTSLLLTAGLAAYGSHEFKLVRGTDQAELDIQVTASQFTWEFFYPAADTQSTKLILPKDKRVRLLITSKDVVHSFWVPQFRLKQDAVPGKIVKLLFTPTVAGSYTLLCAELCGMEHTEMTALVEVVEAGELDAKLKEQNW